MDLAKSRSLYKGNTCSCKQIYWYSARYPKIRAHIFTDVPSDFGLQTPLSTVTKANLMKGYSDGTFRPNQPMTREEVAALFNNITDDGTAAFLSSKFKDITSDRWSALAIESVARKISLAAMATKHINLKKYMSRQGICCSSR